MARPAQFPRERILAAARAIVAERSPAALTIAVLSQRLKAPVGSIYHRYPSRDLLLADLWLDTIESFQPDFLRHLQGRDPLEAGLAAVRFACGWVRSHSQEAHLLLLHRREDFIRGAWPDPYRSRAELLQRQGTTGIREYCRRLYGDASPRNMTRLRFGLLDVPLAALRASIEVRPKMPRELELLLQDTCRHVLRNRPNSAGARGLRRR